MEKMNLTRRNLLIRTPAFLTGLLLLGGGLFAAETTQKKKNRTGPPGSCGRWSDDNSNGMCDHSGDIGNSTCDATKCPAHHYHPARLDAKKNGAPKGTCGMWTRSEKEGVCQISIKGPQYPCGCVSCPAHRTNAG
jgi:hypothetical protein